MRKQWRIMPQDSGRVERLMRDARLPAVVAQLLVSRGVYDSGQAQRFLTVKLTDLHDPMSLPGIHAATDAIFSAIRAGKKLLVYGDYDADGMTGTSILYSGLKLLGADVTYFIPNRLEDGYGLNEAAIRRQVELGRELIISVDCGIASLHEAKVCRELGIPLIITDHHQIGDALPDATALVHPQLPGSNYPFSGLCGAGVAFKLLWALFQIASGSTKVTNAMRDHLMKSLTLAAIGTVADVVPLIDENRALVLHGLKTMKLGSFIGVEQLLRVTGLSDRASYSAEDIAFTLAPRLNAAGRLGQAQLGVELMTTGNPQRAEALADYLQQLNTSRESLERSVYLAAQKQAKEEFSPYDDPALVLAGTGWHVGVIGVVAGRLAEKYARPVILIALDPLGNKAGIGSARAGCDVDLYDALRDCHGFLESCGGHAAAAGLKIHPTQVQAFRTEFCDAIAKRMATGHGDPQVHIDAEATLGQLTLETVQQIESLAPFGCGNPRPILCASRVELVEPPRKMGNGERHLSAKLRQGSIEVRAVAFGQGEWAELLAEHDGAIDVAFRPTINEYLGRRTVQMQLVDWRPASVPTFVGS